MSKKEMTLDTIPEVKKLIELGKQNGEVTYDEINEILPDKLLNSEKIDDVFILLNQLGIEVVEESTRKEQSISGVKKKGSSSKKSVSTQTEASHVDDPIRLYLKEIGKVSLLSGDQEVDLAKRIEEGEILIEETVYNSSLLINDLIKNYSKIKSGKIKLTDVLKINRLYYFSSIDLDKLEKKFHETMKSIIEDDNKIIQTGNRLKRVDPVSKKAEEYNEKIRSARQSIRKTIKNLEINDNEINKLSAKIKSMVARIQETYDFFSKIEKKYRKDLKDLKHIARKLEKSEGVSKIVKELSLKNKDELLDVIKNVRNHERKIRRIEQEELGQADTQWTAENLHREEGAHKREPAPRCFYRQEIRQPRHAFF
jgi:RNA polymerase primary sigma factor